MTEPEIMAWLGIPASSGYQLRGEIRSEVLRVFEHRPVPREGIEHIAAFTVFLKAITDSGQSLAETRFTVECRHCGQAASGYAIVQDAAGNDVRVCHPSDPLKPDCYRRISVYHEPLGALATPWALPMGIEGIRMTEPLPEDQR